MGLKGTVCAVCTRTGGGLYNVAKQDSFSSFLLYYSIAYMCYSIKIQTFSLTKHTLSFYSVWHGCYTGDSPLRRTCHGFIRLQYTPECCQARRELPTGQSFCVLNKTSRDQYHSLVAPSSRTLKCVLVAHRGKPELMLKVKAVGDLFSSLVLSHR